MDETQLKMILTLSSYNNRYYTSATGEESAKWIANQWSHLTQNRSDAEVTLFVIAGRNLRYWKIKGSNE